MGKFSEIRVGEMRRRGNMGSSRKLPIKLPLVLKIKIVYHSLRKSSEIYNFTYFINKELFNRKKEYL